MLDMGFLPDVKDIVSRCAKSTGEGEHAAGGAAPPGPKANTKRQTLFFSATWPAAVQKAAWSVVARSAIEVRSGQQNDGKLSANPNVKQRVMVIKEAEKLAELQKILSAEMNPGDTCMIFCKTKRNCDWLEKEMKGKVQWTRALHSDKEQWEREESLNIFRTMTTKPKTHKAALIATNVAARGLDIPGVRHVIVFDFDNVDDYVHQIGRTGRGGKTGNAFVFYVHGDGGAKVLVDILKRAKQDVPDDLVKCAAEEWPKTGKGKGKGGKGGKGKGKGKGGKGRRW